MGFLWSKGHRLQSMGFLMPVHTVQKPLRHLKLVPFQKVEAKKYYIYM